MTVQGDGELAAKPEPVWRICARPSMSASFGAGGRGRGLRCHDYKFPVLAGAVLDRLCSGRGLQPDGLGSTNTSRADSPAMGQDGDDATASETNDDLTRLRSLGPRNGPQGLSEALDSSV